MSLFQDAFPSSDEPSEHSPAPTIHIHEDSEPVTPPDSPMDSIMMSGGEKLTSAFHRGGCAIKSPCRPLTSRFGLEGAENDEPFFSLNASSFPSTGSFSLASNPKTPRSILKLRGRRKGDNDDDRPSSAPSSLQANVNPFTPNITKEKKRARMRCSLAPSMGKMTIVDEDYSPEVKFKSPAKRLRQISSPQRNNGGHNVSRFDAEFIQEGVIGSGEFGTVMKCRNRLDGTIYAIKRSKNPIRGSADEQKLLREVYAHAVVQVKPHIVRYYSAWEENDHVFIQNEYCDGGSLEDRYNELKEAQGSFTEDELRTILKHVASGLNVMHHQKLAHLDIKPGNIFMKTETIVRARTPLPVVMEEEEDDVFGSQQPPQMETRYKIGDLGLVARIDNPTSIEEGDCRYMAMELLNDEYDELAKVDIFSLGISIYELASMKDLPKNGDTWESLRSGNVPPLGNYSHAFNQLVASMLHPTPSLRPSASKVLKDPFIVTQRSVPSSMKSITQLARELTAQQIRNVQLTKQLEEAKILADVSAHNSPRESKKPIISGAPPKPRGLGRLARCSSVSW